jgi:hypothetical protein
MFADPTTVPSVTVTYDDANPDSGASTVMNAAVFNKVSQEGSKSTWSLTGPALAALGAKAVTMTVSHQGTKALRRQSLLRVDATVSDSAKVDHSVSIRFNIDREQLASTETTSALSKCSNALIKLLVGASGSGALTTTSIFSQFLNGES